MSLQFCRSFGYVRGPALVSVQNIMTLIRQARAAFIGATLEGFNNFFTKHFVDFSGEARRARITHARLFGGRRNRSKFRDIHHQLSFASAKTYTARRNNFEAEFKGLTHNIKNIMQYGAEQ